MLCWHALRNQIASGNIFELGLKQDKLVEILVSCATRCTCCRALNDEGRWRRVEDCVIDSSRSIVLLIVGSEGFYQAMLVCNVDLLLQVIEKDWPRGV